MSDQLKTPVTLQTAVVKRFMNDEDFSKFMEAYNKNKKQLGISAKPRDIIFNSPLTSFDMAIINFHFNSLDKSMSEFCREHNVKPYRYMELLANALAKKAKAERWS